ncbi:site-specific integrase, partial [Patescibacteria group bacterium]|nr:site-specific integrase [Patescibacteria group bacterium]
ITSKSKKRLENNKRSLVTFRKVTGEPLTAITLQDLRNFLSLLNSSKRTQSTRNELKHTVKRFLKWQFKDWSERFDNLEDIKLIMRMNEEKINANTLLRKKDVEAIMKAEPNLYWKAFFISLYESGLRPIELRTLMWENIKFDVDKDGISEINVFATKTHRARTVYVKEATFYLKKLKEKSENKLVFPAPRDKTKPMGKELPAMWLKRISNKVLGRQVYPYILRHSRATELYTNVGIPDKTVQKFLGHSKSMADVYTHLSNKDVKAAVSKTIYKTEDLPLEKKHQLEESIEQHKMEIQELKVKIENLRNFGDIANNLFEDKKLQKALLQSMIKNGFGKQLMELTDK